jgi:multidrug efflux pump subunit AcrB
VLAREYPGVTFYTVPVDIVTQILNFGLAAPIDIQIVGPNLYANRALAERMLNEVRYVPGAADARIQQPFNYPNFTVNVDRTRAAATGLTQQNVAQSLLVALSGSFQTSPELLSRPAQRRLVQRRHPDAAVPHGHDGAAQKPAHHRECQPYAARGALHRGARVGCSGRAGAATTAAPGAPAPEQILGNLATVVPGAEQGEISHYNVQPVIDIYANVEGTDLGSVTRAMEKIVARMKEGPAARLALHPPRPERDHVPSRTFGLLSGLAFSIVLVYLLIVVNFQSWLDPFLIISALPAALAGIVWFLFLTNTRLSVPALTGAIMCMGVATANSILVVSFAREQLEAAGGRRAARRVECRLCPRCARC